MRTRQCAAFGSALFPILKLSMLPTSFIRMWQVSRLNAGMTSGGLLKTPFFFFVAALQEPWHGPLHWPRSTFRFQRHRKAPVMGLGRGIATKGGSPPPRKLLKTWRTRPILSGHKSFGSSVWAAALRGGLKSGDFEHTAGTHGFPYLILLWSYVVAWQ